MARRDTIVLLLALGVWLAAWTLYANRPYRRGQLDGRDATFKIDINTADAATLTMLPGVGPALAERIVRDRQETGLFRSLAELDRVRGIGPKTVGKITTYAVCSPPPAAPERGPDPPTTAPATP